VIDVTTLADWKQGNFSAGGLTRPTFTRGSGPGVIVIHEVPGITPKVVEFANEVVDAGFTVVMPQLVGEPGKAPSQGYLLRSMLQVCVAREFTTWAVGRTSPISNFLRQLARDVHEQCGGPGIGAIGMCFSGGFALGMMVDGHVAAPVLSQPSLPFAIGRKRAGDLNLSQGDLDEVRRRAEAGCQVLGLRFDRDRLVGQRFETLRGLLGEAFIAVEYPSSQRSDHSVVTEQRVEDGVHRVLAFFREKLLV
jgi:dienelactone hydrolase